MIKNKSLIFGLFTASLVLAHPLSGFADDHIKATILEGTGADNAIVIAHGCELKDKPIRAQSVVFPTVNPELIASDGHPIANLSEVIGNSLYAGHVDTIQDKNIFQAQDEKVDSLGNTIGFFSTKGYLQTNAQGRVPFNFVAPTFVPSSCATALNIEIAIADICLTTAPTIRAHKLNLWIPDNGSQYAVLGNAFNVEGIGMAPSLRVKRDLVKNPLNPACGVGFTVKVRPSAADIDANLGIPGWHY
jgi:hypothetical protein